VGKRGDERRLRLEFMEVEEEAAAHAGAWLQGAEPVVWFSVVLSVFIGGQVRDSIGQGSPKIFTTAAD
jgi:hypothetical protein